MHRDLIDIYPDYARVRDLRGWEALVREVFDRTVLLQRIPAQGDVVELGTARAVNFHRLCQLMGPGRCRGYDVSNALEHPRVELADVRALGPAYDRPIALGWNDLSDWRESPASKRAGRRFVLRNLVPGGLYVDAGFDAEHPPPASLPEMDWVAEDRGVVVWRRRGEAMPQPAGTPDRAWWQWLDRMLQLAPQPYLLREAWLTGARAPGEDPTMMASPSSRAAVWASGARELDGRLQWRASARVVGGASEALGQVLFAEAGAPPVRLRVVGVDGAAISCAMAGDEVLIIPRRCSVDRSASDRVGLDRLECLYFEHHPPGPWVSLAHFKAAR